MSVGPDGPETEDEKRLGEAIQRFLQDTSHMHGASEGDPERYRRVNEVMARHGYRAAETEREEAGRERVAARKSRRRSAILGGATLAVALVSAGFAGLAYFAPKEPPPVVVPPPVVTVVPAPGPPAPAPTP